MNYIFWNLCSTILVDIKFNKLYLIYNKTWLSSSHCQPGNTTKNGYRCYTAPMDADDVTEGHAQKIPAPEPAPFVQIN